MNYEYPLKDLGLGKNEIKVYISLLQKKDMTLSEISKSSEVHRVNTYKSLTSLKKKGLIIEIMAAKKKIYRASEPSQLQNLIRTKEEKLSKVLPELSAMYLQSENQTQVLEGLEGIKSTIKDMLLEKKDIVSFGIPKEMPEKLKSFLVMFHRERIKNKIDIKHIYNENAKERINYLKNLKYCDAKYLPPEYNVPATTTIYGNKVTFWIWSEIPFCIIIRSEKMANAYRKYFELLWKLAK